ncbi:MAG: hypothetical protein EA349_01245 [Halomonadaceae bacterium]|nr:MAG: hypothetical protein EA349_01245 [Halomonadaceae bacterium]
MESGTFGNTTFSIGGYIKFDTQMTRTTRATNGRNPVNSTFIIPSLTPVNGSNSSINTDMHANESRLTLRTATPTDMGAVTTLLEFDFLGSVQGDERITNGAAVRLRHAAASFNGWTVGQTWSTFFDPASLPDLLDFVGPVGTTFSRQPLVRYQTGNWEFAAENPSSTLNDLAGARQDFDNNSVPDAIVRYRVPLDSGSLSLAAMGREVAYQDDGLNQGDSSREKKYGYGLTASANFPVGTGGSDIRAQLTGGNAIGRYMVLNGFSEAQIEADGSIDLIDQYGGHLSYRHMWTSQWRSNLSASYAYADNPDTVAGDVARSYRSAHLNLIHSPLPNIDLGGELIYGQRENENRASGEIYRLQLSAKVAF